MSDSNFTMSTWQRLADKPLGKWAFSRLLCWKVPYFGSINPRFEELRPGYSVVRIRKHRAIKNHIGTVHAIAICNLAEIAAGTMCDATMPKSHRWIPKGMTVEYLKKAETDLKAVATIDPMPTFVEAFDLPITVNVTDTNDQTVVRAVINMWITPKS